MSDREQPTSEPTTTVVEEEEEDEIEKGLFEEPEDFYKPPPEPTFRTYHRKCGEDVKLKLVGSHPLWAHLLWNAGLVLADYLDANPSLLHGKTVLELGAGGSLPSIIAIKHGAKKVVVTDYPEKELIVNVHENIEANTTAAERENVVNIQGHLWGTSVEPLLAALADVGETKFDVVIMADLIFNHNQQTQLLQTARAALKDDGKVLVSFSSHRPSVAHLDERFFDMARQEEHGGFEVEHLFTEIRTPMFAVDFGSEEVRSTVHVRVLTWPTKK
ncbi:nicotinamide nmethyltransferase [Acanthamoeba castellanii str. Neff]|uniref:Nicotinamide nmethyltransferase n=1 Tax=Acanthamoeba castellanii (strain ATCC 30010 / Neff) TaxID=1257118 RepID=L8H439_ACACF|nr:nicotinamide nmethyltransferase [Acanthamoeba castellanii str. Neff]ELR19982.1 nicotinamide nmethyltransferase [Acanthamoeba castellanii str. Neff]